MSLAAQSRNVLFCPQLSEVSHFGFAGLLGTPDGEGVPAVIAVAIGLVARALCAAFLLGGLVLFFFDELKGVGLKRMIERPCD